MADPTPRQILDLPMQQPNDADVATVRDYLIELLARLWNQGSNFNSKRPFGNSSWGYDLYEPLLRAGFVEGAFDGDGYIDTCDTRHADRLIDGAIRFFGQNGADDG